MFAQLISLVILSRNLSRNSYVFADGKVYPDVAEKYTFNFTKKEHVNECHILNIDAGRAVSFYRSCGYLSSFSWYFRFSSDIAAHYFSIYLFYGDKYITNW